MATKVKPIRLQVTGTPQAGQVPIYVDDDGFQWGNIGSGGYGKFLSLWDCSTGLPISFPEATPYTYTTGDYFLVDTVSTATPPVNYRPTGSSYTGTASSTAESDEVEVGDVYVYDGTIWLLQSNHGKTVTFANIAGEPSDNVCLASDLNSKLESGDNISELCNDAGYITSSALNCYAQCCDIPTNNCQLTNGCGYITSSALNCYAQCCDIPTDNCQLANTCGYITNSAICNLAQCCDIPTNNCQLTNGCGFITGINCTDVTTALGYTPYSNANPNGYTTCTGTLSSCTDVINALGYTPYSSANPNGYTSCTGTLVPSNIACINGCCLTNGGNICISGGIANDTTCTTTCVNKIWAGTEAEYACVCGSACADTIYYVF